MPGLLLPSSSPKKASKQSTTWSFSFRGGYNSDSSGSGDEEEDDKAKKEKIPEKEKNQDQENERVKPTTGPRQQASTETLVQAQIMIYF